jgi:hypothetical protein
MPYTLQRFVAELIPDELSVSRDEVGEAGSVLSVAAIMANLQNAYNDIVSRASNAGAWHLNAVYNFTVNTSSTEVTQELPRNVGTITSLHAVKEADSNQQVAVIYSRDPVTGAYECQDGRFTLRQQLIRIIQPPYQYYQLSYLRAPGLLAYGPCASSGIGGTTLVVGTPVGGELSLFTDAYVGDEIAVIYEGGTVDVRRVTAYSPTTKTFTLDSALSGAVSTDESFSLLPFLPDNYQRLLALRAAALFTKEFPEAAGRCLALADRQLDEYITSAKPMDTVSPQTVQKVTPGYVGGGYGGRRQYGYAPPWGY